MIKEINFKRNIKRARNNATMFFNTEEARFLTKNCKSILNMFCKFICYQYKMTQCHSLNLKFTIFDQFFSLLSSSLQQKMQTTFL